MKTLSPVHSISRSSVGFHRSCVKVIYQECVIGCIWLADEEHCCWRYFHLLWPEPVASTPWSDRYEWGGCDAFRALVIHTLTEILGWMDWQLANRLQRLPVKTLFSCTLSGWLTDFNWHLLWISRHTWSLRLFLSCAFLAPLEPLGVWDHSITSISRKSCVWTVPHPLAYYQQ